MRAHALELQMLQNVVLCWLSSVIAGAILYFSTNGIPFVKNIQQQQYALINSYHTMLKWYTAIVHAENDNQM